MAIFFFQQGGQNFFALCPALATLAGAFFAIFFGAFLAGIFLGFGIFFLRAYVLVSASVLLSVLDPISAKA